ncbi:MAG: archaeal proteasome endopeptidase complex subunit alpha [Candidatus Atabeyarchaeum deiterrae]
MFAPPGTGYDRAITVFSPDGRLFQVEYALEAVRRGTTAIGIKSKDGVVLAVEKRVLGLQEPKSVEKVFMVDDHMGAAIAGLTADARVLVDQARLDAQINRLTYDEPIGVEALTRQISDLKQWCTQHAGVRPFGVSLLMAGVDDLGTHLYLTDPSGTYWSYKAGAIGAGGQNAKEMLQKEYRDDISVEECIVLALKILSQVIEEGFDPSKVEVAVIRKEIRKFEYLTLEEIGSYLEKVQK